MRRERTKRTRQSEAGIALLIAIFVLLLIGVAGISLIVSSGTDSALASNYRSSTGVSYAALAGVEEARSRLRPNDPNSFKNTWPAFYPTPSNTVPIGTIGYVLNPGPNDNAATLLATYPDNEYDSEFGFNALNNANAAGNVKTTTSIWKMGALGGLPFPGPVYKWVRVNAVSEISLNRTVSPFNDPNDAVTPIFYDGSQLNVANSGQQVLELTSLAVLPNGSQKLLQYLVTPTQVTLPPFLASLSLLDGPGNSVTFHAPASNASYSIKGYNYDCSGNPLGPPNYPAVGVFNNADRNVVINGIPLAYQSNYTGSSAAPDVERIDGTFPANLQSPAQLDALTQSIIQNADVVITPTPSGTPPYLGTATGSSLTPLGMSSSNPLTVVVNGNLDISNWSSDGYGLLLVTGTFTYDPDTTWDGIILVIGQGIVKGSHMQYKQINGAMLVAKTRDSVTNQVLSGSLPGASVVFDDSMQGYGIRYSSCWIQESIPKSGYKVVSFREISQ